MFEKKRKYNYFVSFSIYPEKTSIYDAIIKMDKLVEDPSDIDLLKTRVLRMLADMGNYWTVRKIGLDQIVIINFTYLPEKNDTVDSETDYVYYIVFSGNINNEKHYFNTFVRMDNNIMSASGFNSMREKAIEQIQTANNNELSNLSIVNWQLIEQISEDEKLHDDGALLTNIT